MFIEPVFLSIILVPKLHSGTHLFASVRRRSPDRAVLSTAGLPEFRRPSVGSSARSGDLRTTRCCHFLVPKCNLGTSGFRQVALTRRLDDAGKTYGFQTGPAYQGAVDVRLAEQVSGVLGFHAATILDPYLGGNAGLELPGQQRPDQGVNLLGLSGGGIAAGPDRPNGFVGNHGLQDIITAESCKAGRNLLAHNRFGLVVLPLLEGFPDAEDGPKLVGQGCFGAFVDPGVGLAKVLPALAVPDDGIFHRQFLQHRRRDLAGERAFCFPVHVLRASLMAVPRKAALTAASAVNGGQTTISTPLTPAVSRASSVTRAFASATVLYIFQLPAMMGVRI